jgi:hypothetical protein
MTDDAFGGSRSPYGALPVVRSTNGKPSFRAASARRSSRVTTSSDGEPVFPGYEARCQLQCVGRPQRVNAKKSRRALADHLAGLDLVPPVGDLGQSVDASAIPFASSAASRSRPARADTHSTADLHETNMTGSRPASAYKRRVAGWATKC